MLKRKKLKYGLSLTLIGMSLLTSCRVVNYSNCPTYPIAGDKVAKEITSLSVEEYPNFWDWVGRINKLREELELCQMK